MLLALYNSALSHCKLAIDQYWQGKSLRGDEGMNHMNKPPLLVLATMVITWLVSSINATPPQRQQPETPPTNLALEVTYYKDKPPTYQAVIGHDSKSSATWYGIFS